MEILKKRVLITGGAGFIGSNIVHHLVRLGHQHLVVLDNFDTGYESNLDGALNKIRVIKGDITSYQDCLEATRACDVILHQAALGSVPRSIANPLATHHANLTGFLNLLEAARINQVKRIVYASSSSVYGSDETLPKIENRTGSPLSPYAVTKSANELYANVFTDLYGMELIGLRYFNVFGPRQNPAGPYAAVIPIFINNCLNNETSVIYGDGTNQRDFTYVQNVVQANLLAADTNNKEAFGQVFNIAYGSTVSVNQLYQRICEKLGSDLKVSYKAPRAGEIKNSFAAIDKAGGMLGYKPEVDMETGLELTIKWYKEQFKK